MTAGGRSLTRNRDLSKALQGGDTTAARDSANATFNRLSTSKVLTGLVIADKRGHALFGKPETLDHTLGQQLLADAAQSKEVRHGLIADQQNRPYLMVALPLYHRRQLSGVGGYVLALDSLADEMAKSSEAVAVLMSREGRPFYSTTEQESADVRRDDMGTELATLWERLRSGALRQRGDTDTVATAMTEMTATVGEVAQVMDRSRGRAEDSVSQVGRTGESLQAITQAVARITDMNLQIATAAQEQEHVANAINESLASISGIAEQTAGGASRTAEAGEALSRLADDLKQMVARFRL